MGCRISSALICLSILACARRPAAPQADRLAILRFENLSSDARGFASTDWMGRAFAEILTVELSGVPHLFPQGISSERGQALAAGANRIGYGEYFFRDGRLEARLTIEDLENGRITSVVSASAPSGDVMAAAAALARQVPAASSPPRPYSTSNPGALRQYISGLESRDEAAAAQDYEDAIASDPDFALPYRMLAGIRAQHMDRAGALAVLDRALSRGNRIPEADRARIEYEAATLRLDRAGRQHALRTLVQLDPRDAAAWGALAQTATDSRDYQPAVQYWRKLLELDPANAAAWNQLGYAAAGGGDLGAAVTALRRYQALRPSASDPLDSLGDVHLLTGRLREAEDFYSQAARKDPGFPRSPELFKAAMARLMSGDVAGADAISDRLADGRQAAQDPLAESYRAEWLWISGRRKVGYDRLAAFARGAENGPLREAASRSYGELAIWSLMLGDRAAAREMAQKSVELANSSAAGLAMIARFLAEPPASAAEWTSRIDQLVPNAANSIRNLALAYALLFNQDFPSASAILQPIYERSAALSDPGARCLLAWTWLETGRAQDAAPLLREDPIPPLTGPGALVSFHFPRIYYLRGLLAEKEGKPEEARRNYRLFLQLSGPDPLMWGEEQKARAGS